MTVYSIFSSMNRIFVRFLLWCLLAALPLQGFAAAIRMCGGHTAPTTMQMHGATHDHQRMLAQHHAAADAPTAPAHHGVDEASCSACAACCVGGFVPPSWPDLPVMSHHSSAVALTPTPLVSGYIPDGLERPPRHSRA